MSVDWRTHWNQHARRSGGDEALRQVQRTVERRPITDEQWSMTISHVVAQLDLASDHLVLDLCCGNGLLTAALDAEVQGVVGVDFSDVLLRELPRRTSPRTAAVCADARDIPFRPATFDRVLVAAALQHFEPHETIRVLRRIASLLRNDGVLLVTDIPDRDRLWSFFDTPAREQDHFDSVETRTDILGTWYGRSWLEKLARHVGFRTATAIDQPGELPFQHYRFDLRCAK